MAIAQLALLLLVLAVVLSTVTLVYRAKLDGDLRDHLRAAGASVARSGGGADAAKPLIRGLALEGIATRIQSSPQSMPIGKGPRRTPVKPGSSIQTRGSLFVLEQVLANGTVVTFSASSAGINRNVDNLIEVEALVALVALATAALLVRRVTRKALLPLTAVIHVATRIAGGESALRRRPMRAETELGRLAAAFDQMVDSLETAITEARASEEVTRQFLADASHELRTPVALLQGEVETLLREQPERPARDKLEAALARDIFRLGRLIDDLLGLARVEAVADHPRVEINGLARTAVRDAETRVPDVEITLRSDPSTFTNGDPEAISRVFRNLLDNAMAAVEGHGRIAIVIVHAGEMIEVQVLDDGPGVPDTERERIFERFARLERSTPGSGLGLAIARRIARLHGGDLTCDPCESGASFTLRLPAASAPTDVRAIASSGTERQWAPAPLNPPTGGSPSTPGQ